MNSGGAAVFRVPWKRSLGARGAPKASQESRGSPNRAPRVLFPHRAASGSERNGSAIGHKPPWATHGRPSQRETNAQLEFPARDRPRVGPWSPQTGSSEEISTELPTRGSPAGGRGHFLERGGGPTPSVSYRSLGGRASCKERPQRLRRFARRRCPGIQGGRPLTLRLSYSRARSGDCWWGARPWIRRCDGFGYGDVPRCIIPAVGDAIFRRFAPFTDFHSAISRRRMLGGGWRGRDSGDAGGHGPHGRVGGGVRGAVQKSNGPSAAASGRPRANYAIYGGRRSKRAARVVGAPIRSTIISTWRPDGSAAPVSGCGLRFPGGPFSRRMTISAPAVTATY